MKQQDILTDEQIRVLIREKVKQKSLIKTMTMSVDPVTAFYLSRYMNVLIHLKSKEIKRAKKNKRQKFQWEESVEEAQSTLRAFEDFLRQLKQEYDVFFKACQ